MLEGKDRSKRCVYCVLFRRDWDRLEFIEKDGTIVFWDISLFTDVIKNDFFFRVLYTNFIEHRFKLEIAWKKTWFIELSTNLIALNQNYLPRNCIFVWDCASNQPKSKSNSKISNQIQSKSYTIYNYFSFFWKKKVAGKIHKSMTVASVTSFENEEDRSSIHITLYSMHSNYSGLLLRTT